MFQKDELMEMALYADNAQDGVILVLIFEGVSCRDHFKELVELTEDSIDFESGAINLPERVEESRIVKARTISMSSQTKSLVRRAIAETKYIDIKAETSCVYTLTESNYILRGLKGTKQITWDDVIQRITRIAEIYAYEYLNATTISYSGRLHYMKQLLDSGVELGDAVSVVLQRFGVNDDSAARRSLKQRVLMDLNGEEIPLSQEYFWTQEWQEKINESQKMIAEGRYKIFGNAEELLKHLDSAEKEESNEK